MAKSFDISRKPKYKPAPAPIFSSPAPSPKKRGGKNKGGLVFFVFIVAILTLGFSFNSLSKKPIVKNASTSKNSQTIKQVNPKPTPTPTPTIKPSPTLEKTDTTTPTALKIQILNGTGVETISDQVKKVLETNKFSVESTSKAQFEYGQTYIYYRPTAVDSAKTISTLLTDYKPSLSESQISGLFDILIIIGKQNLPVTP